MTGGQRNAKSAHAPAGGFSLVELLAAITVILILAGLMLAAILVARRHLRERAAASEVKNVETAWRQYYEQYQKWPSFAPGAPDGMAVTGNAARILQGENAAGDNRRLLVFLEFRRFDADTNPVNPWGRARAVATDCYYYVKFDLDHDNMVHVDGPAARDVAGPVVVWTLNPDAGADDPERIIGSW